MSVELAVIAPGLIVLLLLVGAGGRVVEVQGHIDGAARDAARAASLAQSPGQAGQLAQQAALGRPGLDQLVHGRERAGPGVRLSRRGRPRGAPT